MPSFPKKNEISKEAVEMLQRVLVKRSIPRNLDDVGINECFRRGWLHTEAIDPTREEVVCLHHLDFVLSKSGSKYILISSFLTTILMSLLGMPSSASAQ